MLLSGNWIRANIRLQIPSGSPSSLDGGKIIWGSSIVRIASLSCEEFSFTIFFDTNIVTYGHPPYVTLLITGGDIRCAVNLIFQSVPSGILFYEYRFLVVHLLSIVNTSLILRNFSYVSRCGSRGLTFIITYA